VKMRNLLRDRVELALSSRVVGRAARHRIRGRRLILAYHGIVPEGELPAGERALFVTQGDFGAQLDTLLSIADVTSLDKIDESGDGRPRVAITFDDGYRGAVRQGVEELVRRGLPATIFIAPGRLDDQIFWWDALSHGGALLNENIRNRAIYQLGGSETEVRRWALSRGLSPTEILPPYARTATLDEIRRAAQGPGITLGSHSWSHVNLASLTGSELTTEIERTRDWLRREFGARALPWIAYPYGCDTPEVHRAVQAASYVGGVRIGGGWHRPSNVSPLARPRLNVPGSLSLAGFRARLLGAVRV
jgi:peptidoglycan/xylan/chitin deacetylase (PgdA/CDA1 family)